MVRFNYVFVILIFMVLSCGKKIDNYSDIKEIQMNQFADQDILKLKNKKILFGHMSVGFNVLDGLKDLIKDDTRFKDYPVVELKDEDVINDSGFYHKRNGQNSFPVTKCDAFRSLLMKDSLGAQFDIAFFKFCYVDLKSETNVEEVFQYYAETIESIKSAFPKLNIIHVTVPLMVHNYTLKSTIKNWIKKDMANINRNRFNQLLLEKYGSASPLRF